MKTIQATCAFLVPFPADNGMVIEGVPDEVADQVVRLGNAVIIDGPPPEPMPAGLPSWYMPDVAEPGQEAEVSGLVGSFGGQHGDEFTPAKTEPVKRPWGNATKAAWIAWALHSDPALTPEKAGDMSKVQLMSAYGERL